MRRRAGRTGVSKEVEAGRVGDRNETVRDRGIGEVGDDLSLQAPRGEGSESVLELISY